MVSDAPGSFCQNCLTWNPGDRETCLKCGTRPFILAGDYTLTLDAAGQHLKAKVEVEKAKDAPKEEDGPEAEAGR
jgi:hypothetical protein